MEPIAQFRIEGVEEALASFARLGQAIDEVAQSSRLASDALPGVVSSSLLTLPLGDSLDSFGNLTGALSPLSDSIAQALSVTLIPELRGAVGAISEASTSIEQATTALTDAVATMTKTIDGFKLPPIQVVGLSPAELQVHLGALQLDQQGGAFNFAANLADTIKQLGLALIPRYPKVGAVLAIGGGVAKSAISEFGGPSLFTYDEEAFERMSLVRGFPDIASLEDGWMLSREAKASAQKRCFLTQVEFFSARLKELDEKANADAAPLLDRPAELFEREQARALRALYSGYLLELLDRAEFAGGVDAEGFDTDALTIARRHSEQPADQIAAALAAPTNAQLLSFEPIKIDIKVLSDHRLSIRTDNPNSNVDLSLDFYCGPNMVGR